jgi:hypothetical protein
VGIGGEYVRRMWAATFCAPGFVEADDQPAARNPGVLRTELFTLMSLSPIPSLMVDR